MLLTDNAATLPMSKRERRNLQKERKLQKRHRELRSRRIFIVDIENVVGGAVRTPDMVAWARFILKMKLGLNESDQVVIAASHIGQSSIKKEWGSARLLVKSGQDGADLAIVESLSTESYAERYGEIILVSGDGIFAELVGQLRAQGVIVTVAGWQGRTATRLKFAASETKYLDAAKPKEMEVA